MPRKILLISHTEDSLHIHPAGIGEIAHSAKFQRVLEKAGRDVVRQDLYSLFASFAEYESLAQLNYALAEKGHSLLEVKNIYQGVYDSVARQQADVIFLLTWCWGVAALLGCSIHRLCPTITKLYTFLSNEKICTPLYAESDLLVTESLLANQRGMTYGIPAWKLIYVPHQYPEEIDAIEPDRKYLERLAQKNAKVMKRGKESVIVGMVSRLEPRKNCGFALTAAAALAEKGRDFIFILKGNFPETITSLPSEMEFLKRQPWFFWDPDPTPFPQVLREIATFDVCVQLSGYEGASNTIVECMALGKPTVILEGSTNPYLFKEGALFVKPSGSLVAGHMPYHVPDETCLVETIDAFILDKELRLEWGRRAKKMAEARFHPRIAADRLPLLLTAAKEYRQGNFHLRSAIETLYQKDCEAYGI